MAHSNMTNKNKIMQDKKNYNSRIKKFFLKGFNTTNQPIEKQRTIKNFDFSKELCPLPYPCYND